MGDDTAAAAVFEEHRPVLTGVAYRMLGRFADAEDVVQEAWLRWAATDREAVREPRGFLVTVTTRLAIDRLRQLQSRREAYVGPWLPEPVATDFAHTVPDTAERVVLVESVSLAVLVLLESLSPLERAVFVLREAFDYPYARIAAVLDRAEPAVRQLAGRARRHVEEKRARYDADPAETARITERFLAAAVGGDIDGLLALLAPDVRLVGDGGGVQKAPRRVIETAAKVARFLHAIAPTPVPDPAFTLREVNGVPSLVLTSHGRPHTVISLELTDGLVTTVYVLTNPGKLTGVAPAGPVLSDDSRL
ncbi:RNA polymerase sigma factor SigJ [Streptomyces sp. NPDC002574]|uniref:RNA polymerase sigma factor SigJ n=1 Tax=Streptomyces sp. NPDC002574 TaxID=3364652 RepID=UPI0036A148B7